MFMGNAENPLSMYFDNEPNADGDEDFNDDEEPTIDDMEKSDAPISSISDEDYEARMKYGELKQRLDSTKSNILKLRKNKGGSFGDISDKPSTELQRLRDLKLSLEERIAALVASSPYLQAKLKKEEPIVPVTEPNEETEVEPLDEWTIHKMQYYAGISK